MMHIHLQMRQSIFCLCIACLVLSSCKREQHHYPQADNNYFNEQDEVISNEQNFSDTIVIKYAKGLKVDYKDDGVHVTITNPDPQSQGKEEQLVIKQPASRFICTTALQLGNFEVLNLEDRIVGMNTLKNLFSPKMQEQMKDGRTVSIGKEGNFDIEKVMASHPDYIFVSASKHGGFEALKESGVPLITHHGYKETNPLGQAEWIKLIGLLTGNERRANAIFADIEQKYLDLKTKVAEACQGTKLPTVISGRQLRDGWYVVGGKSYMSQIFKDAGADYLMKDNEESGGVTLDFEAVYAKGMNADFWQTDGTHKGDFTLDMLAAEDSRYATMNAFKQHHVIFCNFSQTPYRELAAVQPQLLLADFVKAFHPEILPDYEPSYYKIIQ